MSVIEMYGWSLPQTVSAGGKLHWMSHVVGNHLYHLWDAKNTRLTTALSLLLQHSSSLVKIVTWIPNRQVGGSNFQFQAKHWPTNVYICAVFCDDAATCQAAWLNRVSVKDTHSRVAVLLFYHYRNDCKKQLRRPVNSLHVFESKSWMWAETQ